MMNKQTTKPDFRRQEPPFCVQVELSLGCNLQCPFCGINGVQESPGRGLRHMTLETARIVAGRVCDSKWNPRLEFARRGEPTMNPDFVEIIRAFRAACPTLQIMMTSNGGGLLRRPGPVELVDALFEAGLNILVLDDYRDVRIVPKVRAALESRNSLPTYRVYEYPDDPAGNPHHRYPAKTRFISYVQDIRDAKKGTHSKINNHAGHGAPLREYEKRCAKPFRELGVNWDGSIDLCCIDWVSEYRLGSLLNTGLEEIWQCDAMNAARQFLYHGTRSALRPCHGCDHPSYRAGLLPDPLGKSALPVPRAWAEETVRAAMATGPREVVTALARERIGPVVRPESRVAWGLSQPAE